MRLVSVTREYFSLLPVLSVVERGDAVLRRNSVDIRFNA